MKTIALIGGGGFSSEIAEVAKMIGYDVLGYFDILKTSSQLKYLGVFGAKGTVHDGIEYVFPSFGATDRISLLRRAESIHALRDFKIPSLVSPYASVSPSAILCSGVYVAHGVVINPYATIRENSIINTNATIGHEVVIGDCSVVSGNVFIGGGSVIGSKTLIGPGATIMHSINIGSEVIVSFGSVVGRSIPDGKTTLPKLSKVV